MKRMIKRLVFSLVIVSLLSLGGVAQAAKFNFREAYEIGQTYGTDVYKAYQGGYDAGVLDGKFECRQTHEDIASNAYRRGQSAAAEAKGYLSPQATAIIAVCASAVSVLVFWGISRVVRKRRKNASPLIRAERKLKRQEQKLQKQKIIVENKRKKEENPPIPEQETTQQKKPKNPFAEAKEKLNQGEGGQL